jgi:hypothetical protein
MLLVYIGMTEGNWPLWKRVLVGTVHTLFHSIAACSILIFMDSIMELAIENKVIGEDNLFTTFTSSFPLLSLWLQSADNYTWGLTSALVRFLTALFDIPDAMAQYKVLMCEYARKGQGAPRITSLLYSLTTGVYFWMLATPVVSFIFGTYLFVASNYLCAHMTEAFSSLRIESYKNFMRFHINHQGDMEIYCLGIDRVPHKWVQDKAWSGFNKSEGHKASWQWERPSLWKPAEKEPDRIKLIDYFVIKKNKDEKQEIKYNNNS